MTPMDQKIWSVLSRTASVAQIMNVNEISLEDSPKGHLVRGFDASHGAPVVINHVFEEGEMDLPFSALALNNCSSFVNKAKLSLSKDPDYKVNMEINNNTKCVDLLQFKGKKFKLEFVAGKPETIRAPKGIKDTVAHTFKLLPQDIVGLNQSIKAMGAEDITLISDGTRIFAEIRAGAKDVMSIDLCDEFESNIDKKSFVFSYPFKTFYPAVSSCEGCTFNLTTRGMLNCVVQGINVYVIPRIV